MSLNAEIESVRKAFRTDLDTTPQNLQDWEALRVKYFGRKGLLAGLFRQLGQLDPKERPAAGKQLNTLKQELTTTFDELVTQATTPSSARAESAIDYTLPGIPYTEGSLHPLERTLVKIKDVFKSIGFAVAYGPEVDDDYHNFEALNMPPHHPARDMQDTFFIDPKTVLRTHTSNVQIHLMESHEPPLRFIVPGRVYRNEAISFKSYCLFHQVEGLYVDKVVTFADLKGTIEYFVQRLFGSQVQLRFRPSFFPFTEPSAEVDIWSDKQNQWLEIMGCGMVDPAVFEKVGYDPKTWHGFAFGMGVERIAMLQYGIQDIRLFYQNDIRFLEQF
ncbi:MAG: phenylalanine--tRNA ligase subunit alpha [Fidelibacterota bacterium]